jgi:hypothetical protein
MGAVGSAESCGEISKGEGTIDASNGCAGEEVRGIGCVWNDYGDVALTRVREEYGPEGGGS